MQLFMCYNKNKELAMRLTMKYIDYREKLGLGFCNEEKTKLFLAKAYDSIVEMSSIDDSIDETTYNNFCYLSGIKKSLRWSGIGDFGEIAGTLCSHTDDISDFIYYYSIFINSIDEGKGSYYTKRDFINKMNKWAEESGLAFDFFHDKDGYFIFPKRAVELDDALVSAPLDWLKEYPQSQKEWISALKEYSNLTDDNASKVADSFRKSLERFFQEFFSTEKSLENLKSEYGNYLKERGIPKEISNNFDTLLQSYISFINNYAKHKNKTSKNVLEYIMYQTGNIMRLLIVLKQEDMTTFEK